MHFAYHNEQAKFEVGEFKIAFIGHGYECIKISLTCNIGYPKA